MKKIIMAVAAIAMAVSMFAADISAATRINGKIFDYNHDGTIKFFQQANDSHDYSMPNFAFSISGDKAGASIKITTDGTANAVKDVTVNDDGTVTIEWGNPKIDKTDPIPFLKAQTIWFKPFDMLKISIGTMDVALNKETIDYTESNTDLGTEGFLVSLDMSGFTLDVGLNVGDGVFWLENPKGAKKPTIKTTFIKAGYSADFGSVGAYVAFNKGTKYWGSHEGYYPEAWMFAGEGIKGIDIGAGYKGAFGPVSAFANVIAYMYDGDMKWIRPEIFVSGGVDSFGFALFAAPGIFFDKGSDAKLEVVAKFTYGIGSVTPYLYFKGQDVLADPLALQFKLGATGSVGVMGWDTWAQIDVKGKDVDFSIPFVLTVSF